MGNRCSGKKDRTRYDGDPAFEWNRKIEAALLQWAQTEEPIIKLLLLGAGASGKSTIFKQVNNLYGEGFDEVQLAKCEIIIKKNIICAIVLILNHISTYTNKIIQHNLLNELNNLPYDEIKKFFNLTIDNDVQNAIKEVNSTNTTQTNSISANSIKLEVKSKDHDNNSANDSDSDDDLDFGLSKKKRKNRRTKKVAHRGRMDPDFDGDPDNTVLTPELGEFINNLWNNPVIKLVYSYGDFYQLTDSASYLFNNIIRISSVNYLPNLDDLLRARAPTTGVIEQKFKIDQREFVVFDVGGQRNERRKWIHCFENVTAVLFVCGISEYNQMLYEDSSTNRLTESLQLFGEIASNEYLLKTNLVLFLNKKDLFQAKLPTHPLSDSFPEYTGANEFQPAVEWIKNQFQKQLTNNNNRKLYSHVTCATDSNNIDTVFKAVKDIVLTQTVNIQNVMA